MRARINAYSARPWPSSSRRMSEMRAVMKDMIVWYLLSSKIPPERKSPPRSSGRRPESAPVRNPSFERRARQWVIGTSRPAGSRLDRGANRAEDRADRAAQEEQGDDRHDRDEGEDQRVLRETLAFLVPTKGGEERRDAGHGPLCLRFPCPSEVNGD